MTVKTVRCFNAAATGCLRELVRSFPELATPEFRTHYAGGHAHAPDWLIRFVCRASHPVFERLVLRDASALEAPLLPHVALRPLLQTAAAAVWAHVHALLRLACAYQLDAARLAHQAAKLADGGDREKAVAWLLYVRDVQAHQQLLGSP